MLETVFVCLGINFQTNEALWAGSFSSHHTRIPLPFLLCFNHRFFRKGEQHNEKESNGTYRSSNDGSSNDHRMRTDRSNHC